MRLADALPPPKPPKPGSDIERLFRSRGFSLPTRRRVWVTRRLAHDVLSAHPNQPDTLDFEGIEVASTPFIHELRKTWPTVQPTNMNRDVRECWDLVSERFA